MVVGAQCVLMASASLQLILHADSLDLLVPETGEAWGETDLEFMQIRMCFADPDTCWWPVMGGLACGVGGYRGVASLRPGVCCEGMGSQRCKKPRIIDSLGCVVKL